MSEQVGSVTRKKSSDFHGKIPFQSSLSLCFTPASRCLLFSKINSRQENRSRLSFTGRIIPKHSLERFLCICGVKMSKGFLKFCKFVSNLILGKLKIIVSNLANMHKLNSRINYARQNARLH